MLPVWSRYRMVPLPSRIQKRPLARRSWSVKTVSHWRWKNQLWYTSWILCLNSKLFTSMPRQSLQWCTMHDMSVCWVQIVREWLSYGVLLKISSDQHWWRALHTLPKQTLTCMPCFKRKRHVLRLPPADLTTHFMVKMESFISWIMRRGRLWFDLMNASRSTMKASAPMIWMPWNTENAPQ